jgi:hypothetical protein
VIVPIAIQYLESSAFQSSSPTMKDIPATRDKMGFKRMYKRIMSLRVFIVECPDFECIAPKTTLRCKP